MYSNAIPAVKDSKAAPLQAA
jgi:hypothetical protein